MGLEEFRWKAKSQTAKVCQILRAAEVANENVQTLPSVQIIESDRGRNFNEAGRALSRKMNMFTYWIYGGSPRMDLIEQVRR